jgi:tellurite methyltransferase
MERRIRSFSSDAEGDWVAHLECGHRQHVRHRPPFHVRQWVEHPSERASRIGTPLDCPLCDRSEVPEGLEQIRSTMTWDQSSIPSALLRDHRIGPSRWAVLRVLSGRIRFTWSAEPGAGRLLEAGATQGIPPGVPHRVEPLGPVQVAMDFFEVPEMEDRTISAETTDEGGDPACWAEMVCEECGAVVGPDPHRPGCSRRQPS